MVWFPTENPEACPSACVEGGHGMVVRDPRGERNDLEVRLDENGSNAVREHRARLRLTADGYPGPDTYCYPVSARRISCAVDREIIVRAGAGDDRVRVGWGQDVSVVGGPGDDVLRGFADLTGGPGNDQLTGVADFAALDGGPGNDTIRTRNGLADVNGGPGDDVIYARSGGSGLDQMVRCGPGTDRVVTADRDDQLRGCEHKPRR
jgi:Ca2+-binding RTX toxin-like protein